MATFQIDYANWTGEAEDRDAWREMVSDGAVAHNNAWLDYLAHKRGLRH